VIGFVNEPSTSRGEVQFGDPVVATALLDRLLGDATWPCRAHMRTRLHNDVDQYIQIPNPLHGVST
jgi:hypothetical protein